jgi:2,3-dihydroxyphenylpropionate 1,2-dioxygenase
MAAVALSHSPPMSTDIERVQGLVFRQALAEVVAAVRAFDPTLVVYFGPDHLRALVGIAPCFTLAESATGYGDWGTSEEDYDVPTDVAVALGQSLVGAGIDIAVAPHLRLDHGFGQSTTDLLGGLSVVPMLPIVINCIDRPVATAARTAALGTAVGEFLRHACSPEERVLVVGSGGLSHAPPSLVAAARDLTEADRQRLIADNLTRAAEAINPPWDSAFLERIASPDWGSLATLSAEELQPAGTGGAEVRTWIATAFAAGEPLQTVAYEPVTQWITGMGIAVSASLEIH